jgi:hypothetical protein
MDATLDYTVRHPPFNHPDREALYWDQVHYRGWCCVKIDIAGATYELTFYTLASVTKSLTTALEWGKPCFDVFDSVLVKETTKESVHAAIQYLVSVKFYDFILPTKNPEWEPDED